MTNILLMLLLSVSGAQRLWCPASCVVCSEDAVICHRLAHIIDAPHSTQALLLTEGSITSVQPPALSDLSNVTIIGLSHNRISVLGEHSFTNLSLLHTLLLDHNLLTSRVLQGGALTHLGQLKVLALGNNHISMVESAWFEGLIALQSLKLEGNLLTSLDSGSFPVNDFRQLESLDLSDNLIDHIDGNSFHGLVGLRTLDLSRNRLSSAPAEAFSYLSWLANLSLEQNRWNCSCQLLDLAAFLSSFIQQPDKVLHNGRRMVCVSADNPAVTTVLELTEANCVPSNRNITVRVEAASCVPPRLYAQHLAITAGVCFSGGVGLTMLIFLIHYQVSRRKKLRERKRHQEKEEAGTSLANHHVNHLNGSEKRRSHHIQANSSQPRDRGAVTRDPRTESHGEHFGSRGGEGDRHFRCPDCSVEVQRGAGPSLSRWDNGVDGGMMEEEEERDRRRGRVIMEEDRRRPGTLPLFQHGILAGNSAFTGGNPVSHGSSNYSAQSRRETLRAETPSAYRTSRETDGYRTDMEGKRRGHEGFHCESCHRTYRPSEQNARQDRLAANVRDSALFYENPSQYRQSDRGRNVNHNHFDVERNRGSRRETRNVTFNLESFRMPEGGNIQEEDGRKEEVKTSRDKERGREGGSRRHKAKVQSGRLLRVKLNLNPLRRSKVHPKRKNEHSDKNSPKKERHAKGSKEKRRESKGGESEKKKKSAKAKRLTEDEEEEEEENGGEGRQKSKTSSKQNKDTKTEQPAQESTDQQDNTHPENSQHAPGDSTNTADSSDPAGAKGGSAVGQGQITQGAGLQFQGSGLLLGSGQLSSQLPFPLSAADRSCTSNVSLLSSAGSQMSGSALSLQGANVLLGNVAPLANAMFSSNPANAVPPNLSYAGPNMASGGVPDSQSFMRQARVGVTPPATSLLVNSIPANPLLTSATHTSPLQTSQAAGLHLQLAANPAISLTHASSQNLITSDPAQGPGPRPQSREVPPAPQTTSVPQPTQAPIGAVGLSAVAPQAPESLPGENLNQSSLTGATATAAGPTVGESADVSGVSSSNMSSAVVLGESATPLLQQEYLSEDGGSSPKRKLRLVLPEKTSDRPPTALERKIR